MSLNHGAPEIKTPSWERYYLNIAKEVAQKCKCYRGKYGAIIVKDDQIISTGYVGAPRKTKDCLERGNCLRNELNVPHGQRYELCRSVHAEQNAIINAARSGVSLLGGDMYMYGGTIDLQGLYELIDIMPCSFCKRMIINAGLKRVIGSRKDGGINIFHIDDWVRDWQLKDIVDDIHQYCEGLKVYQPGEDPVAKNLNNEIAISQTQAGNLVLAVVGMPGSGKTEVCKYIEGKGFKKVYFGQITFDEIKRRGLETNEANEKMVREDLRQKYGMAAFAILSLPKVKEYYNVGHNVVIESLYSWDEYLKIKQEFGDKFQVIAVHAAPEIRYARVVNRTEVKNSVERQFTLADVQSRDKAQIENLAIGGPIAMADYSIINAGTLEELYQKVDAVLEKLKS